MPEIFTEGEGIRKLSFEFFDKWQVIKYDEPSHENFYHKYRYFGLKAVDFIANSNKCILMMEVKYVIASDEASRLSFSQENDKAMLDEIRGKLPEEDWLHVKLVSKRPWIVDEVVKKTKDTLLGILGGCRQADERLSVYNHALFVEKKPILLILFLERNEALNQPESFKLLATNLKISIEQKVSFLGDIEVLVINTLTLPPKLGINVSAAE